MNIIQYVYINVCPGAAGPWSASRRRRRSHLARRRNNMNKLKHMYGYSLQGVAVGGGCSGLG